jgi:hypothetical protein
MGVSINSVLPTNCSLLVGRGLRNPRPSIREKMSQISHSRICSTYFLEVLRVWKVCPWLNELEKKWKLHTYPNCTTIKINACCESLVRGMICAVLNSLTKGPIVFAVLFIHLPPLALSFLFQVRVSAKVLWENLLYAVLGLRMCFWQLLLNL